MFKNYIKLAFRYIRKNRSDSFIHIAGFSIGMTCFILITQWVLDEISYDSFHEKRDRLCRIITRDANDSTDSGSGYSGLILPEILKDNFPEILEFTRVINFSNLNPSRFSYLSSGAQEKRTFKEDNFFLADSSFFQMFTFSFIKGNPETALNNRNNIVLTEETAAKYFGKEDPVGKTLIWNNRNEYTVTGVVENVPRNSSIEFDLIAPTQLIQRNLNTWAVVGSGFVLLDEQADIETVESKILNTIRDYGEKHNQNQRIALQPILDIHLNPNLGGTGDRNYVYSFSFIALFILLMSCINFVNLSTAKVGLRAREIGLRKVVGVHKNQIRLQFLSESIILSLISLVFCIILLEITMPLFNNLAEKQFDIDYFGDIFILPGMICFAAFIGSLSGGYPAFILSSFQPVNAIRGTFTKSSKHSKLRIILTVLQFSISIILIIGTGTIYKQIDFFHQKDLGFNREQILSIPISDKYQTQYETLKNELRKVPNVVNITTSSYLPTNISSVNPVYWEGRTSEDFVLMTHVSVDYDYIETMKMEMVLGRSFKKEFSDNSQSYIINESAMRMIGFEDPIGKMFSLVDYEGRIIGVVKDFNYRKLSNEIEPLVLNFAPRWYFTPYFLIRIEKENISETIENLEKKAKMFDPNYPFEYRFLDDAFNEMYMSEQKLRKIISYFSFLSIFISSLGLFGMVSFMAERKTKEIGIRKVLGATVSNLLIDLTKDFTKWILFANIIAWPVAYYFTNMWIREFSYQVDMGFGVYILGGVLTLGIAIITVSFKSIKAARKNPVNSLRCE